MTMQPCWIHARSPSPFERLKSFVFILAKVSGRVTTREELAEFEKDENITFAEEQTQGILACNAQD